MKLAKLGHVALVTPDLETSVGFFKDVIGLQEMERAGDSVYLRAWGDTEHHSLVLTAGSDSTVDHVAWRTEAPEDVAGYARQLEAAGTAVTWVEGGSEAGQGDAIRFRLPSGQAFELYYEMDKTPSPPGMGSRLKNQMGKSYGAGIAPRRIDHLNINVANPPEIHAFLAEQLGFKMRELLRVEGGFVPAGWMAVTALAHDIAVMHDPEGRPDRFHHVAYYCDNWHDVLRGAEVVRESGLPIDVGPGKHGGTQGFFLYVKDPGSGHRVEVFSGGYLVFDPDHEPYEWTEEELADLIIWYGPQLPETFLTETTGPGPVPALGGSA
jgi:catechol 2,3-dioxygenase